MKRLVSAVALGTVLASPAWAADSSLDSDNAKLSYGIGVTLSRSLQQDVDKLDTDAFTQAIRDVYGDKKLKMSDEEITQTLSQYQQQKVAEQQASMEKQANENKAAGEKFLAQNAKKDGVKTTDSGLQYKVLTQGKGPQPKAGDQVKVNYEGKLLDGTVFDSSYERGEPVTFRVDQVIDGWQQALKMMHKGGVWMLYVPADLAYGQAGTGGPIGPNQTLIFKVELLDVMPKGDDKQG